MFHAFNLSDHFNYNNYITKKIKYQLHLFPKKYCIFSIKVL